MSVPPKIRKITLSSSSSSSGSSLSLDGDDAGRRRKPGAAAGTADTASVARDGGAKQPKSKVRRLGSSLSSMLSTSSTTSSPADTTSLSNTPARPAAKAPAVASPTGPAAATAARTEVAEVAATAAVAPPSPSLAENAKREEVTPPSAPAGRSEPRELVMQHGSSSGSSSDLGQEGNQVAQSNGKESAAAPKEPSDAANATCEEQVESPPKVEGAPAGTNETDVAAGFSSSPAAGEKGRTDAPQPPPVNTPVPPASSQATTSAAAVAVAETLSATSPLGQPRSGGPSFAANDSEVSASSVRVLRRFRPIGGSPSSSSSSEVGGVCGSARHNSADILDSDSEVDEHLKQRRARAGRAGDDSSVFQDPNASLSLESPKLKKAGAGDSSQQGHPEAKSPTDSGAEAPAPAAAAAPPVASTTVKHFRIDASDDDDDDESTGGGSRNGSAAGIARQQRQANDGGSDKPEKTGGLLDEMDDSLDLSPIGKMSAPTAAAASAVAASSAAEEAASGEKDLTPAEFPRSSSPEAPTEEEGKEEDRARDAPTAAPAAAERGGGRSESTEDSENSLDALLHTPRAAGNNGAGAEGVIQEEEPQESETPAAERTPDVYNRIAPTMERAPGRDGASVVFLDFDDFWGDSTGATQRPRAAGLFEVSESQVADGAEEWVPLSMDNLQRWKDAVAAAAVAAGVCAQEPSAADEEEGQGETPVADDEAGETQTEGEGANPAWSANAEGEQEETGRNKEEEEEAEDLNVLDDASIAEEYFCGGLAAAAATEQPREGKTTHDSLSRVPAHPWNMAARRRQLEEAQATLINPLDDLLCRSHESLPGRRCSQCLRHYYHRGCPATDLAGWLLLHRSRDERGPLGEWRHLRLEREEEPLSALECLRRLGGLEQPIVSVDVGSEAADGLPPRRRSTQQRLTEAALAALRGRDTPADVSVTAPTIATGEPRAGAGPGSVVSGAPHRRQLLLLQQQQQQLQLQALRRHTGRGGGGGAAAAEKRKASIFQNITNRDSAAVFCRRNSGVLKPSVAATAGGASAGPAFTTAAAAVTPALGQGKPALGRSVAASTARSTLTRPTLNLGGSGDGRAATQAPALVLGGAATAAGTARSSAAVTAASDDNEASLGGARTPPARAAPPAPASLIGSSTGRSSMPASVGKVENRPRWSQEEEEDPATGEKVVAADDAVTTRLDFTTTTTTTTTA